jgi:hypothetical protein
VFTRSFLPILEDAGKSMVDVAKETRAKVKMMAANVGHQQSPAYYDEIDGNLFLARPEGSQPPPPSDPATARAPAPEPASLSPPAAPSPGAAPSMPLPSLIFADSDRRYLARDELARLTREQLRIARNEIFARRGRHFRDPSLVAYFSRFTWYRPRTWDPPLNAFEEANIALIQSLER